MDNFKSDESSEEIAERLHIEEQVKRNLYQGPIGVGFWVRALARIIDTCFGYFLGLLVPFVAIIILAIIRAPGSVHEWLAAAKNISVGGFFLSALGATGYHAISEYMGGASLGKLICGLRVIGRDLRRMTFRSSIIRSLAFYIDGFFFGVPAYFKMSETPANQRIGDQWAHTLVVKRSNVPTGIAFSGTEMFFGILTGSVCWGGFLILVIIKRVFIR